MSSLVNTEVKPFKATAFHNGKFVDVSCIPLPHWSVLDLYNAQLVALFAMLEIDRSLVLCICITTSAVCGAFPHDIWYLLTYFDWYGCISTYRKIWHLHSRRVLYLTTMGRKIHLSLGIVGQQVEPEATQTMAPSGRYTPIPPWSRLMLGENENNYRRHQRNKPYY